MPLDRHQPTTFFNFIEVFYSIGFDQASEIHQYLIGYYRDYQEDETLITKAERVLSFGITWIKSLLDNPGIWVSDMLFSDRDPEQTNQIEEYLEKTYFTGERVHTILHVILTQYIILTREEIEQWKEDSLKFFLQMKYQSNEVKGNLLRDRAKSLIAGIQLRFGQHFDSFCAKVI